MRSVFKECIYITLILRFTESVIMYATSKNDLFRHNFIGRIIFPMSDYKRFDALNYVKISGLEMKCSAQYFIYCLRMKLLIKFMKGKILEFYVEIFKNNNNIAKLSYISIIYHIL